MGMTTPDGDVGILGQSVDLGSRLTNPLFFCLLFISALACCFGFYA